MDYTYRQLIGGKWLPSANSGVWAVENPATEEPVREVPFGDAADCRLALEAAAAAFPKWSRSTAYERAAVLKRAAELIRERAGELGRTTVLESGKPFVQAKGEWSVAADLFEWFAEEGKRAYGRVIPSRNPARRLLVLRQPVGVVGIITAWNFPIYNIARAAAAALAAGCTVVLRPSEYTPLTAMELVNVLIEAGIPEGVVNLVNGEPAAMGQEMLSNPLCAKIHFTGSPRVGRLLMDGASRTVTRLSLELGGNAPVLIFPDVDLDQVAAGAVVAKFRNGGQVCVSPQRFFVHRSIAAGFAERVAELAGKLCLGNGLDLATQVGPLINARAIAKVQGLVEDAVKKGAKVETGGHARDLFFEGTVLTGATTDMEVFSTEIFGPVAPLFKFDTEADGIRMANDTPFGLAAYAYTRDIGRAMRVASKLQYGMVGMNDGLISTEVTPFGGMKESGLGREGAMEGLDEYLQVKYISYGGLGDL